MKVIVLGCGSSGGVPSISRGWGDCDPTNPKNRRLRSSIIVEEGDKRLLIDATPDLREQFLREDIKSIDSVLITHEHFDHTGGVIELRDINRLMGGCLNIYGSDSVIHSLHTRFPFIFKKPRMLGTLYLTPYMKGIGIESNQNYEIAGFKIIASNQTHGIINSFGYRINDFGYITDFYEILDDYKTIFKGIKKLIIACQSFDKEKNMIHAPIDDVLRIIDELKVDEAYLTHMCPSVDYEYIKTIIPSHIKPAYDGLCFEL